MGIPNRATRIVYSGDFSGGIDRWAFSLWLGRTDDAIGQDFSTGEPTATTYVNWRTKFLALLRPEDHFTQLDSYRYSGGVAVQHTQATFTHPGTGSATTLPTECCAVMTFRTALASRSGRGRIYLPVRSLVVDTTAGTWPPTPINDVVDNLATYLTSFIGGAGSIGPVVVSPTLTAMNLITSVDADYVPDTQRRRGDRIRSTRHSHTV
jgi:hypothetical protein